MSAHPVPGPMSLSAFLAWEARQSRKYELVDGVVVAMAGASLVHNRIAANFIRHLGNQLAGKPCQPYGSDAKLISPTGNIRYPDVQVDCGRIERNQMHTTDPRLVVEVLSPSNDWIDVAKLRADYQAHDSVAHILFVSSLKVGAQLLTRDGVGWREETLETLEGVFDLPAIEARLTLAEIYEGVDFEDAAA